MPADYLTNTYFVIETPVNYVSEVKPTILNSENNFNNFVKNMPQFKSYGIKFYGNISGLATNNSGLPDGLSLRAILTYTGYEGNNSQLSYFQTEVMIGQNINFSILPQPLTISTFLDASNPSGITILDGQEKTGLVFGVKPTGSAANITEHKFKIFGQSALAVQVLKLFDGPTLVGQASVVAGSVTILGNTLIPENTTKVFTVKAVVSGVYSDISGYDFSVVLDKVTGTSVTTANTSFDDVDKTGNSFDVFKTLPIVEKLAVAPLSITNNSVIELYRFKATAQNSPVTQKQFAFNINLNDQATNDTLFLKNFKIFEDGVDVTSQYRFTDASGAVDTMVTESDIKLYCTRISGTGETVINSGSSKIFVFKTTVGGFNHIGEGDGFSISMPSDNNHLIGQKYLNSGGTTGNAKLYSSATASSNSQVSNYICSDLSAVSHSGQLGLSSNDWFNGNKVFASLPANIFFH
jgi:hypothetical protein